MPRPRAPHRCLTCTNLVPASDGPQCRGCKPRSGTPGYGNRRWLRASRDYRRRHPTCQCTGCPRCTTTGCHRPSTQTDHIDGLGLHGPRAYDETNWAALCAPCHSHKTATQDGGFGRR